LHFGQGSKPLHTSANFPVFSCFVPFLGSGYPDDYSLCIVCEEWNWKNIWEGGWEEFLFKFPSFDFNEDAKQFLGWKKRKLDVWWIKRRKRGIVKYILNEK